MTLILSGTDGLSDVDGTAATPAIRGTDTNTGIYFPAADTIAFSEGGVESMRLDSSGNLGIGTSSPSNRFVVSNSGAAGVEINPSTGNIFTFNRSTLAYTDTTLTANNIIFQSGGATERARITSGGNLLVGTTAALVSADNRVSVDGTRGIEAKSTGGANAVTSTLWNNATTGDNVFLSFRTEAVDTQRGTIDYNRAGGLTRYNTTSDYRAKDIIGPVQNPGATIDALKVYEGKMKGATQSRPMLIAHEAQDVVPFCVSGIKDETNNDGTPKYQQMDHASLVPLLVAAIQEQQTLIQSLTARIEALEGK